MIIEELVGHKRRPMIVLLIDRHFLLKLLPSFSHLIDTPCSPSILCHRLHVRLGCLECSSVCHVVVDARPDPVVAAREKRGPVVTRRLVQMNYLCGIVFDDENASDSGCLASSRKFCAENRLAATYLVPWLRSHFAIRVGCIMKGGLLGNLRRTMTKTC